MTRNLRILSLALLTTTALLAVAGPAAAAPKFTTELGPGKNVIVTGKQGKQENVFKFDVTTVKCKTVDFQGELVSGDEAVTIQPSYGECTNHLGMAATVDMEGCDYFIHANGTLEFPCEEPGERITITTPGCEITLIESNMGILTFDNGTHPLLGFDVTLTQELGEGLVYEEEGLFCKNPKKVTEKGWLTGSITLLGADEMENFVWLTWDS